MTEAGKEEPDYRELERIIGADVGLAGSLIKTANSPFFGLREPARSVYSAITVLGIRSTIGAVAGIVLRNSFPHLQNMERFWDGSARISRLSGWLALQLDIRGLRADDAYTFGLFRDCGIGVLLGRFKNYQSVLGVANQDSERSFTDIEDSEIETNHARIGAVLAQTWCLPEDLCKAIRHHHEAAALSSADPRLTREARLLISASQLGEHLLQRQLGLSKTQEWDKLGAACLQILEIHPQQLEDLYAGVAQFMHS